MDCTAGSHRCCILVGSPSPSTPVRDMQDKFVELHGDRAGLDDPAMVCGIGSMDGVSFMFIGHQKGRNTKVTPCPGAGHRHHTVSSC